MSMAINKDLTAGITFDTVDVEASKLLRVNLRHAETNIDIYLYLFTHNKPR